MAQLIGRPAPNFSAIAVHKQDFKNVCIDDFSGKCIVLFFYPMDFTKVCSSEVATISGLRDEFTKRGCVVLGISCDSHFTHLAWVKKLMAETNEVDVLIPLVSDKSGKISKAYGVYDEENGVSSRAFFLIDHQKIVRSVSINDRPVGRSIEELVRLVDAVKSGNSEDEPLREHGQKRPLSDDGVIHVPFKSSKTSHETNAVDA